MIKQGNEQLTEIQDLLELRVFAYDMLRRVFLSEPTKELVTQFENGIIHYFPFIDEHSQLKAGVDQVNRYFQSFHMDEQFDSLHWDYTRMFIGPYKIPVPIWESSYVNKEGLLFQEETLKVRRLYLKNNLMSMQYGREADDHLGLELDFMFHLSKLLTSLANENNISQFHKILADQNNFLKQHLLNWTHHFCENVNKHSRTDFYKGMAKILTGFLNIDKVCLEELLTRTKQ